MMLKLAYPVEAPDHDAPLMAMRGPFEQNVAALKQMGYQGIELLIRDPEALAETDYDAVLDQYGMKVAAISTAPLDRADHVNLLSPTTGDEAEKRILGLIPIAARYGCPISIGKARGNAAGGSLEPLADRLGRLEKAAADADVMLLLEPQNRTNIDNLNTIAEAEALILRIGPHLGLHLDTYHMDIAEKNPIDAIRRSQCVIGFVHIADRDRQAPGQGGLPWHEYLEALSARGFTGWLSPEIKQTPDSAEAARLCMEWALHNSLN